MSFPPEDIGLEGTNMIRFSTNPSEDELDSDELGSNKLKRVGFVSKNEIKNKWISDLNELHEKFNTENDEIIDQTSGFRILNGDEKHLWFRDNVALYFAIGRIFDDDDKELLTNILSYFDPMKRTYLGNFYKILSYSDPVIEGFERKLNIGNGNYHFILIVISYPSLEDIKFSPDTKFMNRGVSEYYTDTSKIKQRMIELIREYGLTAELELEFDTLEPITVTNSFTHKDIQFDIRGNIDKDLMKKHEIPQRIRQNDNSQRNKQLGFDKRNINPLNKRISQKGSDILSIPIPNRAIYSRITDGLQIDKTGRKEFKLYGNDDDFIQKVMPDEIL